MKLVVSFKSVGTCILPDRFSGTTAIFLFTRFLPGVWDRITLDRGVRSYNDMLFCVFVC